MSGSSILIWLSPAPGWVKVAVPAVMLAVGVWTMFGVLQSNQALLLNALQGRDEIPARDRRTASETARTHATTSR
mgnify:CR=1 FL=1